MNDCHGPEVYSGDVSCCISKPLSAESRSLCYRHQSGSAPELTSSSSEMSSEFQICAIAQVGDSELYIKSLVKGLRKSIRTEVGRKQSLQTRLSPFRSDLSPLRPECPKQKSETFTSLRRRDLKRVISDRLTRKRSSYAGKATLKGAMLLVSYCRPTGKHAREKSGPQVASRHRYTNSIPNVAAVLPDIGGDLERPAPNIMESWDVRCCNQGRGNAELIHGDRGASALPGVIPFPRLATPPA